MSMGKRVQEEWVIELIDELKRSSTKEMEDYGKKRSIYMLPPFITDLNKEAYEPKTVSFGPYHHGKAHLKPMEEHKHRALRHFLERSNKPLECYIDSLAPVVQDLKDSYDSLDASWKKDTKAFSHMMILDGCFMLEILLALNDDKLDDNYANNDRIFSNHGKIHVMPYIRHDMLMIENQLPMPLLHNLLLVQDDKSQHGEFLNELLEFFSPRAPVSSMECLHVLDVHRKNLLFEKTDSKNDSSTDGHPVSKNDSSNRVWKSLLFRIIHSTTKLHEKIRKLSKTNSITTEGDDEIIRSVTELHEAGIRFKQSKTESLKDISFDRGVLSLPHLGVDDSTESMFLNLLAFERSHVGVENEVTSYIWIMDDIIDDAKDVSLLCSKDIMKNLLGSDKAVAKLFNSLAKGVTLDPPKRLKEVNKAVNNYCKQPWHKWRANLIHTYFKNPWASIALLAAIFLFALTFIQTTYTVLPYYHPRGGLR